MEDAVVKFIMNSRGVPGRCDFSWIKENGEWTRCLNNRGVTHGDKHQHALSEVLVGQEDVVQGMFIEDKHV